MLRTLDLSGVDGPYRARLPRGQFDVEAAVAIVRPIVDDVAARGAEALNEYSHRFDGVVPPSLRVPAEELAAAAEKLDPELEKAFREAIRRRREVAQTLEVDADPPAATLADGAHVGLRNVPVERVGLYVPGGLAPLASSVIMNVVPAQEAGVGSLVVCSPPQADCGGWPHPTVLAACSLLGVDDIWAVGGGQAIALMAYGDDVADLAPVDMITGPGNIFVTAAKRLCRSVVGIDAEAGPTEIAVLADASANPVAVAYDLISQAEHDPMAASVLITDSVELADAVDAEVAERYKVTLNHDRVEEALTGVQSGIILTDSLDESVRVADAYAAEHLEVQTQDAPAVAARITNAGAVFVGPYSPVPLGDYAAGSNHVLPTSGTARHSSGLSTHTFLKHVDVINYDRTALQEVADTVTTLADAERLPAHGEAVKARFENPEI